MGGITRAGEIEDIAMLQKLLSGEPAIASQFSTQFLDAVPLTQLNSIVGELLNQIGEPMKISPVGDGYEITTATHTMAATIALDNKGRIAGLFFRPPVQLNANLPDLVVSLEQFGDKTSYLVMRGDIILAESNAEKPMAIGSAFKLAILRVLQDEIGAGDRQWDDVELLSDKLRSLPSGILQEFPDGAPITLHTLAALMISQSDNTATDILLNLVGREKVSAYLDGQFVLSTREFFQLKDDQELAIKFAAADKQGRINISQQMAGRPLPAISVGNVPYRAGVEWYLSAKALCTLLKSVSNNDVFEINPGPASTSEWARIAYKGGSEVGVINLTSLLVAKDGEQYCVIFSANDTEGLSEIRAISAYASLLSYLADMD